MTDNIHTLILPDIHGRLFWKSAIELYPKEKYPDLDIVFLGDYLDPYDFEYISKEDAIYNFENIIDIAEKDNRVHLLLGNHDWHYIDNIDNCRIDKDNFKYIKNLFLTYDKLFNIAYENFIEDKRYFYTHAGVTKQWWNDIQNISKNCLTNKFLSDEQKQWITNNVLNKPITTELLNSFKYNFQGNAWLSMISFIRGGDNDFASCIWADYREMHNGKLSVFTDNTYQIFGHTLSEPDINDGIVLDNIAMLDSRCAWVLNKDKTIFKL